MLPASSAPVATVVPELYECNVMSDGSGAAALMFPLVMLPLPVIVTEEALMSPATETGPYHEAFRLTEPAPVFAALIGPPTAIEWPLSLKMLAERLSASIAPVEMFPPVP